MKPCYEIIGPTNGQYELLYHESGDPEWGIGIVIAAGSKRAMKMLKKLFEEA